MKNNYQLTNKTKFSTHSIFSQIIDKNNNVLDIGCNDGYLKDISHESNTFYGIDYSETSVREANKKFKSAVQKDLNDLNNLALPWNIKFDVLVFGDILEHLLYPEKVLNFYVNSYLKENGVVIISLPNVANFMIRISLLFGKFNYSDSGILDRTHLHLYTFKSALELIKKNENLVVEKIYGGSTYLGLLIYLFPFLKGLFATNIIYVCRKK